VEAREALITACTNDTLVTLRPPASLSHENNALYVDRWLSNAKALPLFAKFVHERLLVFDQYMIVTGE